MMQSDHILVKKCLDKDPRAQQQLYELYASKMFGICLRYFQNHDDAREAYQEAWIKVFLNLERFRSQSLLSTWMHRIFVTTSVDLLRTTLKDRLFFSISDELLSKADDDVKEEFHLTVEEAKSLLNMLPDKYRIILNLYAIDGLGHPEIAKMLGISEGASRTQLSRARLMIKEELKKNLMNYETGKPSYR